VAVYETAIVRLCGWAPTMPTAGLGLLVGAGQLVTCAHVVNTALGRGQPEQVQPAEWDLVQVEFPLLADTPVGGGYRAAIVPTACEMLRCDGTPPRLRRA